MSFIDIVTFTSVVYNLYPQFESMKNERDISSYHKYIHYRVFKLVIWLEINLRDNILHQYMIHI